jgi:hypothetical protein
LPSWVGLWLRFLRETLGLIRGQPLSIGCPRLRSQLAEFLLRELSAFSFSLFDERYLFTPPRWQNESNPSDASAPNNAYLDLVGELTAFVNV